MKKSCFVFDFDGVLCDSMLLSIESYNWVRTTMFSQIPTIENAKDYVKIFSGDPDSCLYDWLSPDEAKSFYKNHTAYTLKNSGRLKIFPLVSKLLTSVPTELTSILTTNLKATVHAVMKGHVPEAMINQIPVYGKELGLGKRQMFSLIFHAHSIRPENVYYICDSPSDIVICNELKVKSIAVGYGYFPLKELQKNDPSYQVNDEIELSNLLTALSANV